MGDQVKTIGVLAPMPSELGPVSKAMALGSADSAGHRRGTVGRVDVIATKTGMGTQLARAATERLLDAVAVDHVMVVGIAGGFGATKVGDILVPEVVVLKDTGAEYRPHPIGGMEPRGKLVTHDDFDLGDAEHERLLREGFDAVDMETAAIAAVCTERSVAWSAVRAISDLVGVTPGDVINLANPDGTPNVGASIRYLVTKPWRIPKLVKLGRDSMRAANSAARRATATLRDI